MNQRNPAASWLSLALCAVPAGILHASSRAGAAEPAGATPTLSPWLGGIPSKFTRYDVVAVPDKDEPEWWCGAPSVVREVDGTFWMAARMRTAQAPLGQRGYEIRIFRSGDGIHFKKVHSIKREDVPLPGFERPALLIDPKTGKFKLYSCGRLEEPWCIFKFDDADSPEKFIPSTAKTVIAPLAKYKTGLVGRYTRGPKVPQGYKDPVIFHAEGAYHCYVIGGLNPERTFHFVSDDGETFKPVGHPARPVLDLTGWHSHAVRPAGVVPLGVGYLFIYEGSDARWDDPVYNIATGLGFTFDLHHIHDLTPDGPMLMSTTPGRLHVWRYSHWLWVKDELWAYAEVEKPNGSHEIRLFRIPKEPK